MINYRIRLAAPEDAAGILEIYAPYVTDTAISWEYKVPTVEEFAARIEKTLKKYPYFVLTEDSRIVGYAYAGPFIERAAYNWSASLSIYLAPEAKGHGYGRLLYETIEDALKKMGIRNMYACICDVEEADEYVDRTSPLFHARLGFHFAGRHKKCGSKFGRWYDMIWMEKVIGEHGADIEPVKPYPEVMYL